VMINSQKDIRSRAFFLRRNKSNENYCLPFILS
jgi:hypothetical protein